MMKIHTTQNLNSLGRMQSTNSSTITNDEIRLNYSEQMRKQKLLHAQPDSYESGVSFKGKEKLIKDSKKVIVAINKKVGEVVKEGQPERIKGDKMMDSPFFHTLLRVAEYENVAQAAMAAIVCIALRPAAIMLIPTKKNKEDNIFASAHSMASGSVGLVTTAAFTVPFKKGHKYVMDVMLKDLQAKTLKRLYPHVNEKSIINKDGLRKEIKEWVDTSGNKFTSDIKDVAKLPDFKHLGDVSAQTFKEVLKVDADWAAQKGKSFNDVVLKDGRQLYDAIDMSRLGFVVKENGINDAQILFKDIDKEYLEKVINDAKNSGSKWSDLDINSVFDGKNVVDFRNWKDMSGKQWKLDLDEIYVSSPFETANYKPRISGKKRFDAKDKEFKFTTYQKNGINDKLGTEITNEMVEAESANEGLFKLITWLPDLAFRVPIAATTIALIPWILKHAFHLEKSKNVKKEQPAVQKELENMKTANVSSANNSLAFKGKGNPKETGSWFVRMFGKYYGKKLMESETAGKVSKELSKVWGGPTQLLTTLGSLITSSVYVQQTLTKKDLDPERRKTLALNQALCFVIPTIAAYSVDRLLKNWTKKREYRFSGLQERKIDMAKFEGKATAAMTKNLGDKLKGIRLLTSLTIFTFIYRFATPVIITPLANAISNKLNERNKAKQIALQPAVNTAKEVELNSMTNTKQIA